MIRRFMATASSTLSILLTSVSAFGGGPALTPSDLTELKSSIRGPRMSFDQWRRSAIQPLNGHFVFTLNDGPVRHCLAAAQGPVEGLPPDWQKVRTRMHDLSWGQGSFVESACWVFVFDDEKTDLECIRGTRATEVTQSELDSAFLALQGRKQSRYVRHVFMIHTHPDLPLIRELRGPTDYDGPSQMDLTYHARMEQILERGYSLPVGSLTTLVFPLDRERKLTYYFKTNRVHVGPEACP